MKPLRNIRNAAMVGLALACAAPAALAAVQADAALQSVDRPASGDGVGLAEAVAAAVAWHPRVREAAGRLFEAGDQVDVVRAGYFPQVSAGLTSERGSRNVTGYNSRQVHRATVSVSQMLYDFGKLGSAMDRARAWQAAAQARVLLAVDELAREASLAWIEVRRHEALQMVAREQVEAVTAIAGLVRERHRKGASPRSDAMQARAREEAAQARELQAAAQLDRWRAQLRHLAALEQLPSTRGGLPSLLQQACAADAAVVETPAVLAAQAETRAAEAELAHARAQTRPTLSLDGTIGRGLDAESRLGETHDATVMLNVSAPLYQGGGSQARRRAAGHALASAEAALDHARLTGRQQLEDARTQAAGHVRRSAVLEARVASLEQTRVLYQQQYLDLGTRSLLDLLNAEQEYQQARIELVDNAHDLARLQVECVHAGGRMREVFGLDGAEVAGVVLAP